MKTATMKCFDCGHEIPDQKVLREDAIGSCPKCGIGIVIAYTFDGEPINRGYFPPKEEESVPDE